MDLIQHLENIIEKKISNEKLYIAAFEHRQEKKFENERLEYLGDAVIELIISDFLFKKYFDEREGFLTITRAKITNRKFLNDLALKFNFDQFVHLDNDTNTIKYVYGCIFEAFVGALYLDLGYEESAKIVLEKIFLPYINFNTLHKNVDNYKGQLLEYFNKQKRKVEFLTYQVEEKSAVIFESRIVIDGILQKEVEVANSKKEAEQNLSKRIFEKVYK